MFINCELDLMTKVKRFFWEKQDSLENKLSSRICLETN